VKKHPSMWRRRIATSAVAAAALAVVVSAVVPAAAKHEPSPDGEATPSPAVAATTSPGDPQDPGFTGSDTGSPSAIAQIINATAARDRGWSGRGVDVALIDTGVARVPGLDAEGKVVDGPDLSFDAQGSLPAGVDAHGHGTFMAGLIAAKDEGSYAGVAPDARLVNVKVGAADGGVDVSQVIAAIHWVTQHAHDPGLNIRVLSLSFGTDSVQAYYRDPLAQAAEQAWKHGIVVVVAAGNDGRGPRKVASPAYDPYVIAAGGQDPRGTIDTADDRVPDFAQHGTQDRPVDVIAPAAHVIGLRVPGSFVDTAEPNTGRVGTRFQRGSGTSQAAALVAGGAALLAQKYPGASPDTIKKLLTGSATPLPRKEQTEKHASAYSGHGIVNLGRAVDATPSEGTQDAVPSRGDGTIEKSRAGEYVTDGGIELRGEKDIFGRPYDSAAMASAAAGAGAWDGGTWNGSRWTGDGWSGSRWTAAAWSGTSWAGTSWSAARWSGMSWDGSRWTGDGWSGSRWTGSRWSGSRWSTAGWR
jgi:serine protease AprX